MRKKVLDKNNSWVFTASYPYSSSTIKGSKQAILGIGGNVGHMLYRFEHLFIYFKRSSFLNILETSPILINPPFGYTIQNDFYNAILLIETNLRPKALLRYVLRVEKIFGRKRSFKDAPRTLDIDIIFYESIYMNSKVLAIPHIGWTTRSSVLLPLQYLHTKRRLNLTLKYIKGQ